MPKGCNARTRRHTRAPETGFHRQLRLSGPLQLPKSQLNDRAPARDELPTPVRILAIVLTVLVALAIVTVLVGERLIARENLKDELIERVEASLGGQLAIDGAVDVSLFPRPRIRANDAAYLLPANDGGRIRLTGGRVDAAVRPLDLLRGRLEIEQLDVIRPTIWVRLAAAGPAFVPGPGAALPLGALRAWASELRQIRIADGTLILASAESGSRTTLEAVNLDADLESEDGPFALECAFTLRSERIRLEARIGRLAGEPTTTLQLEMATVEGAAPAFTASFSGVASTSGRPAWRGQMQAAIDDPEAALATLAGADAARIPLPPWLAQPLEIEASLVAGPDQLALGDLRTRLGEAEGRGRIDLRLKDAPEIDARLAFGVVDLGQRPLAALSPPALLGWLPVPLTGTLDLTLDSLRHRGEVLRRARVNARLLGAGSYRVEQGRVTLPGNANLRFRGQGTRGQRRFEGEIALVSERLRALLAWIGLEPETVPEDGLSALALTAGLSLSPAALRLSGIESRLDASRITGTAELDLRPPGGARFDLRIDRLNLDTYLPPAGPQALIAALRALADDQLAAAVQIETLMSHGLRWQEVSFEGRSGGGQLVVEHLDGIGAGDTTAWLSCRMDLQAERGSADLTLTTPRPALLLRRLGIDPPLGLTRLAPLRLEAALQQEKDEVGIEVAGELQQIGFSAKGAADVSDEPAGIGYVLDVEAKHPNYAALLEDLALAIGDPAEDTFDDPLEVAGTLRGQGRKQLAFTGTLGLGPSRVTGDVSFEAGESRPHLGLNLSLATPRLDTLMPLLGLSGLALDPQLLAGPVAGAWPRTRLRTEAARAFDLSLELNAKGGLAGPGFEAIAQLVDGRLDIPRLAARTFGGDASGEASFDLATAPPFGAVALTLSELNAASVSRWLGLPEGIVGQLDGYIEASALGGSLHEIIRNLAADATLTLRDGALTDLPRPVGDRFAVDGRSRRPLAQFEVVFDVARGIATITEATSEVEPAPLDLAGSVDLLLWVADLTARLPPGDESPSRPMTIRIVGPLDRPQVFVPEAGPAPAPQ